MSKLMRKRVSDLLDQALDTFDKLPPDTDSKITLPIERLIRYRSVTKVMLIAAIEVMEYVLSQRERPVHP